MDPEIKSILETVLCKDLVFEISSYFWKEYPWNPKDFKGLKTICRDHLNRINHKYYQNLVRFKKDYPMNIKCIYYANTKVVKDENFEDDEYPDIYYCLLGEMKTGEYFLCYAKGCLPSYTEFHYGIYVWYFNSMQIFKGSQVNILPKIDNNMYGDWLCDIRKYLYENNML